MSESAAKTLDTSSTGDQASSMTHNDINSQPNNNNNNDHESSIKLKRCKHGRIRIKDLSKKKLGQRDSDNSANSAHISKHESNNNRHSTSGNYTPDETSPNLKRRSGRKRKKKKRSLSDRRYRRTPERHDKYPESYRHHRRSSRSRSHDRRLVKSRSRSPLRDESDHRRHRRGASRSPSRDGSNYDRYPSDLDYSMKNDLFEKLSHRRSPKTREPQASALNVTKVDQVVGGSNLLGKQPDKSDLATQVVPRPATISTNSTAPPRTLQQTAGPNFLPRLAQADPDPREDNSACSPATPSNGGSAASDIYDPEGPVLPISPVDSPPIVEKGDDEDVPSSAVQLNQQEKYLQKFHRQERVVEEVKIALKPFYQRRTITKEQYKDVLRKAVPRICHSKNGEINPVKIRSMVDAYVKKMR